MRLARFAIALAALGSSPALAENWVTVFEDDPIWGGSTRTVFVAAPTIWSITSRMGLTMPISPRIVKSG